MYRRFLFILTLCFCSFVANSADIVIKQGRNTSTKIAINIFLGNKDISEVISSDLHNSGYFEPVSTNNQNASRIPFGELKSKNIDYFVDGFVKNERSGLTVVYRLFNVASESQILGNSLKSTSNVDLIREISHTISDKIFEQLTGIKGSFNNKILYVTAKRVDVSNNSWVYTLQRSDYDGHNSKTLLQSREPILSPSFSPDGKRVVYVSFETRQPRIYIQTIATGAREQVTNFSGLNSAPAFSPDGKWLAFVLSKDGNPEIYAMHIASRAIQRLTHNSSIDTEPFWGRDNSTIYFTSDRAGTPQIYKLNTMDGSVKKVTSIGNYNASAKISNDEAYVTMVHRQSGYSGFRIALLNLQNNSFRTLSETSLDESPTISPNGTMILYSTQQNNNSVIMLASSNGRVRKPLINLGISAREVVFER